MLRECEMVPQEKQKKIKKKIRAKTNSQWANITIAITAYA